MTLRHLREIGACLFTWLRSTTDIRSEIPGWGQRETEVARWIIQIHGIGPMLFDRFSRQGLAQQLPTVLMRYVTEEYQWNAVRIKQMMRDLTALLDLAQQAHVPVMPLKGSVLLFQYYPDPALRPMADLDLLVPSVDVEEWHSQLISAGYRTTHQSLWGRSYLHCQQNGKVVRFTGEHPDNPRSVEVHTQVQEHFWGLEFPLTPILWAHAREAVFDQAVGLTPEPAALLTHLLIHTTRDLMDARVRWVQLYDLSLITGHLNTRDWEKLLIWMGNRDSARLAYAPFHLMSRYLGAAIPDDVMGQLTENTPPRLRSFLDQTDLISLSYCRRCELGLHERFPWYWPGYDRWVALRRMLLPQLSELRRWYPEQGRRDTVAAYLGFYRGIGRRIGRRLIGQALERPR